MKSKKAFETILALMTESFKEERSHNEPRYKSAVKKDGVTCITTKILTSSAGFTPKVLKYPEKSTFLWAKIFLTGNTNKSRNLMLLGNGAVTAKSGSHDSPIKTTTDC